MAEFESIHVEDDEIANATTTNNHGWQKPVDQQQRLQLCFDQLMADITRSLETKNRDKFTQNLTKFRNDFRTR
ncbi:hypothetical protein Vadar_025485 [Vaccinium darrowii]|uniref:Uncharacterized protein n=1 Tax=Vaccinium darrowii TaxID=229202 RepID=A0ACB7ZLS2_9ERIC|nr:hypothetical protein Vadar_025485 [Vaccinium darrowii]